MGMLIRELASWSKGTFVLVEIFTVLGSILLRHF